MGKQTTANQANRFWNFKNAVEADSAELRISGNIVDDDDLWIYEWFDKPAAAPNAFREELAQYAGKNLNVWIDSYGGSVFAATGIYNALMNHKNTGGTVTTIGDGKVMSAAVTVFMSGDVRKMTPGCILMTHNPLTSATGYASDLRKTADVLEVVKECIIGAYKPTGLDDETLSAMMDDETYMSAKMAVKNGFATDILYSEIGQNDVQNSPMNFSFNRLAVQNAAGDSIKKYFELAKNHAKTVEITAENTPLKNKEDKLMDSKELQEKYPDLYKEVYNFGVANERGRMKAIEDLALPGNDAILNKARYETGESAEQVAVAIVKAQKAQGSDYLNKRNEDVVASNVAKVPGAVPQATKEAEEAEIKAAATIMAEAANAGRVN